MTQRTAFTRCRCASRTMLLVAIVCSLRCGPIAWAETVERRGSEQPLSGQITVIDDSGVTVRSESGVSTTVSWDRVRSVTTDRTNAGLDPYLARATELWRARSRLERNDAALAEPIFETQFKYYRGKTSETALVVAEGLLRCKLARQAQEAAVIPAIETARLRRARLTTNSYQHLPAVLDEHTMLCPSLPPAWAPGAALSRLESELANYDSRLDPIASAVAALYRQAARAELGMSVELPQLGAASSDPGVALLAQLVGVRVVSSPASTSKSSPAREALERNAAASPAWIEAWSRYALGESALRDSPSDSRQRGVLELLHIPARFGDQQPYLAGLALWRASDALELLGQRDAASSLRTELTRTYPTHPVANLVVAQSPATQATTQSKDSP